MLVKVEDFPVLEPSQKTWVHEGPRAFCKGIDLASYEMLKDMFRKYILHDEDNVLICMSCSVPDML